MKEPLRGIRFRTVPEILQAVDRSFSSTLLITYHFVTSKGKKKNKTKRKKERKKCLSTTVKNFSFRKKYFFDLRTF